MTESFPPCSSALLAFKTVADAIAYMRERCSAGMGLGGSQCLLNYMFLGLCVQRGAADREVLQS